MTKNYVKEPFVVCTDPDIPVVNAIIKYTNCIKMIRTHQFGVFLKELSFPTATLEVTDSLQVAQIFFKTFVSSIK